MQHLDNLAQSTSVLYPDTGTAIDTMTTVNKHSAYLTLAMQGTPKKQYLNEVLNTIHDTESVLYPDTWTASDNKYFGERVIRS